MHFSFSWRRYLEDDDDIGSLVDPEACFQSDQGGDISISPVPVAKTRITPSNKNGDPGSCYDKHMSESPHVLVQRDANSDSGNNADNQDSIRSSLSDLAATLNDAMRQGNDPAQCETIDLREMSGSDVVFVIDENTLNEYLNTKGLPLLEGPLSLDGDSVTFLPLVSDEESDVDTNTEGNVNPSAQLDEGSKTVGIENIVAESATSESKEGIKDSETEAGSKETVGTTEEESACTKQTRETMEATSNTKEARKNTHPVSGAEGTIRSEQRTSGAQEVKKITQVKFDAKEIALTGTVDKTARVITKSVFSANEPAVSEIKVISLPNKNARTQLREAITKKLNQNGHREATGDGKELHGDTTSAIASSVNVLEKGDQVSGCTIHYENEISTSGKSSGTTILTSGKASGTMAKVRQTNSLSRVDRSSEKQCSVGVDKNRVSSPCKRQRSATCLIENECTRRKL